MKVYVYLNDGFETAEALTPVDLMRRAGLKVLLVSLEDELTVKSAQDISVTADIMFEKADADIVGEDDLLLLPGGPGHVSYMDREVFLHLLSSHAADGGRIAAICAAPSILGRIGLLRDKKATCFPGFEKYLEGAELVDSSVKVVTDDNITTSRGMGTAFEFGLELVKICCGEDTARKLAESTQFN